MSPHWCLLSRAFSFRVCDGLRVVSSIWFSEMCISSSRLCTLVYSCFFSIPQLWSVTLVWFKAPFPCNGISRPAISDLTLQFTITWIIIINRQFIHLFRISRHSVIRRFYTVPCTQNVTYCSLWSSPGILATTGTSCSTILVNWHVIHFPDLCRIVYYGHTG